METEFTNLVVFQLVISCLGGGVVSAIFTLYFNEKWNEKRERRQFFYTYLHRFFANYHLYVRLLRSNSDENETLDRVHSDFLADVKLLETFSDFNEGANSLKSISKKMANIRNNLDVDSEVRSKQLEEVFDDFGKTIRSIVEKI